MENKRSIISKVVVAVIIITMAIFSAIVINNKEAHIRQLNKNAETLGEVIQDRDSLLNDLFTSFSEIETSLNFIKQRRNQIEIAQDEGEMSQHESIINGIRLIDSLLERNTHRVKSIESKLKSSGFKVAALTKKIVDLNNNIEQQNNELVKLKGKIEERDLKITELNDKVNGLEWEVISKEKTLVEKTEIIQNQENELNKAFLAFGTFRELKENGVAEKDGGLLGIGGKKIIPGDFDESYFIKLDMRETREIPLFSKKVSFISEHPDSSYRFLFNEGLVTYLEIENPEEFWKISKYAVLETR